MSSAAQSDSGEGHRRDISPDGTHVRMSLARFLSIVVGIGLATGSGMGLYWNLRAHETNAHIHVPEDFAEHHGSLVGDRDIEASKRDTTELVNQAIKANLAEFAETLKRGKR